MTTKRWKVRGGCSYSSADGKVHHSPGMVFSGTEEEVQHHRDFIEEVIEKPEPKPEPLPEAPPRRGPGRPRKQRAAFQKPPEDRAE